MASQRSLVRLASSLASANRILVNMALDGALAAIAAPLARFLAEPEGGLLHPLWFIAGGMITLLLAGLPFRLPQQYWRFSGLEDLLGVVGGSIVAAMLFSLLILLAGFPLPTSTFPVVHALVLMAMLGAPRVAYRLRRFRRRPDLAGQPVLLVGAGQGADLFLRALDYAPSGLRPIGLLATRSAQIGRRIHRQPILGELKQAGAVLDRLAAEGRLPAALVVTEPDLAGPPLAQLLEQAETRGIPVRRAPRPTALHPAARLELAPVAIEDLLNRPQVPLDREAMARLVQGRRVLVTGAGGTIGSELARQVAALGPAHLTLLDNGEYALWQIDLELAEAHPAIPRTALITDIRDAGRVRQVVADCRPELVFHAAALKHVPIVESNPLEGLLTNAAGTRHVADAARDAGALAMVLISTDKAVNPTSVMGASKRLAEMYCQALDIAARGGSGAAAMRCVTVRFGNVLGSTGSVVPLFRRQLERGGPLTVTHPDMRRYFMTVREAVGLVLQATVAGSGLDGADQPPEGGIFVLDMGEPVKIVDLARQMIRLAGLRPDRDVQIAFTGLRPGEKLYEELFHGQEPPQPTGRPGLLMAMPRTADPEAVSDALESVARACRAGQSGQVLALLERLIPEFSREDQAASPETPPAKAPSPVL